MGLVADSARLDGPVQTHITPHTFLRCRCSGNIGDGGIVRNAKKPLTYSGALRMNGREACTTSTVCSSAQNVGPAYTVLTGCARNSNEVTTPKFPPPPRSAQNKSAFCASLAVTTLASANT